MYYTGQGVPQDFKEAVGWYTKAAEQGYLLAQGNLAMLYADEDSMKDRIKAHMWLSIAGANGNTSAKNKAWIMEVMMSPEQIAEANRLAEEWLAEHQK